jgi:hypothetical protein
VYILEVEASGEVGGGTITSNKIRHKVLRYSSEVGTFLLGILMDDQIEQHTDIPVSFLLAGTGVERYAI